MMKLNEKLKAIQSKPEPFQLPDGYFETFSDRIMLKTQTARMLKAEEEVNKQQSNWVAVLLNKWSFAGLCLILVLALSFPLFQFLHPNDNQAEIRLQKALTEIDESEIELYVLNNLDEFEPEELALNEKALEQITIFDFQESITDEDLYNYYLNNFSNQNITEDLL